MSVSVRIGYPLWLAQRRLRRRLGRATLVGAGIATGAAVLALVSVGGAVIEDRSLAGAVSALPPAQRTAQVSWYGTIGTGAGAWRPLDRLVRSKLRALGGEPVAVMLFHEASIRGRVVDLRAVDGVGRFVHLQSGRLPRTCRPAHCEVLRLAGAGPLPSTPHLRVVEVGRAVLPASAPFRDYLGRPPADTAVLRAAVDYHTPASPPLVLAEGVEGLSRTQELATLYRSYAWFLPVTARGVHPWNVDRYRGHVDRLRSELATAPGGGQLDVAAPTDELTAAAARGDVSARRLLLVGGQAAALLLAFVVLAASTLRRDADAARRRLTWLGARRWQLALLPLAEAAAVAAAATAVGWCAGAAVGAVAAEAAGVPAGEALRQSAASAGGIALAAALAGAAALLLFAVLRIPPRARGAGFGALDGLALGAVVAIAVGLARGGADAGSLAAGGGTGWFLLLLPALVAFVAAVAAARLLAPLLRVLERFGRRGPVAARLAALSLARSPGRATAAVAFLVVALGFALFAAVYRSTLATGEREQAAFAVPADFVLSEDLAQLVPLNHLPEPAVAPGAEVTRVVRQTGNVSRLQTSGGADVLGIPAARLLRIGGWRSDFASQPLDALAAAIRPSDPVEIRTVPLPRGASTLELPLSVRGRPLLVRATVRLANGDYASVRLGETPSDGRAVLRGPLPRAARGLLGLSFGQLNGGRRSANGGTGLQPTSNGRIALGQPSAGGRAMPVDWSRWIGVGGVESRGDGDVRYALTSDADSGFRVRQATDGVPVAAIVTPALAAAAADDGTLPFEVAGERIVLRVAGVADRFPGTTQRDFVVADAGALGTALDASAPGVGRANERWVDVPPSARKTAERALARPPFDVTRVASREAVEHDLRADPLARGVLIVLGGTALVALLLALAGIALVVVGDARDERGDLFDLETQGAEPRLLRRHLRLRMLAVVIVGAVAGAATGAVLCVLVLDVVRVTAAAADPQPPLALVVDRGVVVLAAAAFAALAAAVVAAVGAIAYRADSAGRFREAGA